MEDAGPRWGDGGEALNPLVRECQPLYPLGGWGTRADHYGTPSQDGVQVSGVRAKLQLPRLLSMQMIKRTHVAIKPAV